MGEGCICGDGKKEAHVRKRHKVTQGCLRGQGNNGQDAGYIQLCTSFRSNGSVFVNSVSMKTVLHITTINNEK